MHELVRQVDLFIGRWRKTSGQIDEFALVGVCRLQFRIVVASVNVTARVLDHRMDQDGNVGVAINARRRLAAERLRQSGINSVAKFLAETYKSGIVILLLLGIQGRPPVVVSIEVKPVGHRLKRGASLRPAGRIVIAVNVEIVLLRLKIARAHCIQ